jgi:plastocyanin
MRFNALALVASAIVLGACGGGGDAGNTDTAGATAGAAGTTPAAPGGGAAGTATASPITGKTHEVKMILDGNTYRFDPENITVKTGDGIKFTTISGMPHNFGFDPAKIPDDVEPQLRANMPAGSTDLESPYQMNANESHTLSLGGIKAGKYEVHCTPHLQLGMKGLITVE